MNLSDLIAAVGDEKVQFQRLDDCVQSLTTTKHGSKATFTTPQTFDVTGFDKLGLIVWMDREDVAAAIAKAPPASLSPENIHD